MKRIISVLLTLCLIIGAAPLFASAASDKTLTSGDLDPGKVIIHNVLSESTVDYHGAQIPLYTVSAGKLFTRPFEYRSTVQGHNCGNCGTVVSVNENRIVEGKLYSANDNSYAELGMEAFINAWHSPESKADFGSANGYQRITSDSYTFSSSSVGKVYGVLIQYEDDSDGRIGDAFEFAIKVADEPTAGSFSDVQASAYYADAVAWAVGNGITAGIGGGKFAPGQTCKREQIVTFLYRSKGSPAVSVTTEFTDMPKNEEFQRAISWAVKNNITVGDGKGKFNPEKGCTRAEAMTFIWRAAGKPEPKTTATFSDMPANQEFCKAISWAVENGIAHGTGNNKFSPNDTCRREHIVTFLYNAR